MTQNTHACVTEGACNRGGRQLVLNHIIFLMTSLFLDGAPYKARKPEISAGWQAAEKPGIVILPEDAGANKRSEESPSVVSHAGDASPSAQHDKSGGRLRMTSVEGGSE